MEVGVSSTPDRPRTLFDKVWDAHVVSAETAAAPAILYVDLHLVHEVTSPQAFTELDERGLKVRRPDRTFATLDHSTPTLPPDARGARPYVTPAAAKQVETLQRNCAKHGVALAGWDSADRGVVHVMAPELGLTQPGMVVVCGDSHTATHGAFGALAFGIGTSEVGHVLATQCLLQRKPKRMRVTIDGVLQPGVAAKDLTLAVIAALGFAGGSGFVIEYAGEAIRALDMEERMTLCNMSIEAGARAGMIAPDDKTFAFLKGRRHAPQGDAFARAEAHWRELYTDDGATFDREIRLDARTIAPMATFGTTPDAALPIGAPIPRPRTESEQRALDYMHFKPGESATHEAVDVVFIGSCTNGRISDLRAAADVLRERQVAKGVRMLVVPGSETVRRQAEAEGLDRVFTQAGAEWRLPGCSMCIAMNGDFVQPGQLAISTSNRNFEGRQGKGARTILVSPATAAASAVAGVLTDPRTLAKELADA
ncbi:MAG: 3-isopropylmalate dehydratase large subunit [Hyphomonadaceae bacterium]|nr:3-isopropylmalate dehydratase large subunit [Hyphomonadaceae bacterium]